MLRVYIDNYRRAATTTRMSEELEEDISCLQEWPGLWQKGELVILKGLASGEDFTRMDQEQTIPINGILVK